MRANIKLKSQIPSELKILPTDLGFHFSFCPTTYHSVNQILWLLDVIFQKAIGFKPATLPIRILLLLVEANVRLFLLCISLPI